MNSKTDALYSTLIHPLAAGEVAPGQRLPSERELAKAHGVSRDTINRTLTQLEADGLLLRSAGRRATYANPFLPIFEGLTLELNPSLDDLRAMLALRAELEAQAAFYCAQRASDEELEAIANEYVQMRKRGQGDTTLSKAKADLRFHTLIAESSHHLGVSALSQIFYARFFNAIYLVLDHTLKRHGRYPERIGVQHNLIYSALMARNAEEAAHQAREHVLYTRSMMKSGEPLSV
ncbi:MAG: FadR family transcriptional regulator [Oceanospirillaceae bacterium]|nr:FadR family transcriptional regulator [Oceanospirillaceae bacterium]